MANEITISWNARINKRAADGRYLIDRPYQRSFRMDMTAGKGGPVPGLIQVPLTGVNVDLSQLTTPSFCVFTHHGRWDGADVGANPGIYYVDVCMLDLISGRYLPLPELWPGDSWPMRLSRNLQEAYNQTGTGTGPANNRLRLISHIAACAVSVEAFEL